MRLQPTSANPPLYRNLNKIFNLSDYFIILETWKNMSVRLDRVRGSAYKAARILNFYSETVVTSEWK